MRNRLYRLIGSLAILWLPIIAYGQIPDEESGLLLYGDRVIGQSFQYHLSNLDRVGIGVRKSGFDNFYDLTAILKKSKDAKRIILEQSIPVSDLPESGLVWIVFRPLGDDENPEYYIELSSPQSAEGNAPVVRLSSGIPSAALGTALLHGVAQEKPILLALQYERSLWTRISYVLARFEIDKPWFFNRYVYVVLFTVCILLTLFVVLYIYRLFFKITPPPGVSEKSVFFLSVIVFLFLCRGILYSSIFPAWQAPDEPAHFSLVKQIADHGLLSPPVEEATIQEEILLSMDLADYALIYRGGRPRPDWQSWQTDPRDKELRSYRVFMTTIVEPYLYYMIVSIPYRLIASLDTTTQLFLLRLLMVFFSCGVIILAFKIGQVLYPEDQLPFVATTCLCFYSQFVHIGSIVSYDVLVNLFASLFLYYLLKANCSGNGWRHVLKSGIFLGMALFTKASALMLLPGVILWWMLNGMKTKAWREITLKAAVLSLTAFCIGGWWYAKNLWLYQQFVVYETPSWHYHGEMNEGFGLITIETLGWLKQVSIFQNYRQALWNSFYGLTGSFGWGNVPLKPWMYVCSGMVFGSAIIGAGVTLTRIVRTPLQEYINKYSTHVLFYGVCICYCALLFLERGNFVMGRYYFPIIVPAVYLFIVSIRNVFSANKRHVFLMCFTILFIIFDTLILLEIIIPRYYLIPPPSRLLDYF